MEKEQRGRKEGEGMPGRRVPIDVLTGSLSGNMDFNPNFSTKWMNVISHLLRLQLGVLPGYVSIKAGIQLDPLAIKLLIGHSM